MSNAAVFERRNKQIQDAINGGSLKQALQLCEKRIKKGENSPFLLVSPRLIPLIYPSMSLSCFLLR